MEDRLVTAYLALGSNLGDRSALLDAAVNLLGERAGRVTAVSSPIETEPAGFQSPHPFLNQALALETTLAPSALLSVTQEIEKELGRSEKSEGGIYKDRPIDIDLILYGDLALETPGLTLPHPRFRERPFVLRPLSEIAGDDVTDPVTGKTISELLWAVS